MVKVGVVDDHHLFRKSFVSLISRFKGVSVVLEAENGKDLFKQIENNIVDVLLLDVQMPEMDGYETCRLISKQYPTIKILMVSQLASKESIAKAVEMGAHGYFSKYADVSHIETALRCINSSGFYFDPSISNSLHDIILWDKTFKSTDDPLSILNGRELQLIVLICNGYSNAEVANRMSINLRTVESYRKRILDKTEAPNFTTVVLLAVKYNYVSSKDLLIKSQHIAR